MDSSPPRAQAPRGFGGFLRTTIQRAPPTILRASVDASPESLLRQLESPAQFDTAEGVDTAEALPTPSLDALAEMDLAALRQLAWQRGDRQVESALAGTSSSQLRREYLDSVWDDMEVDPGMVEQEEEEEIDWAVDEPEQFEWADEPARDWALDEQDEDGMDMFSPPFHEGLLPDDLDEDEDYLDYVARTGSGGNLDWATLAEDVDSSFWPGLLGERPLNPRRPRPSPPPPIVVSPSFFPSPHATSSLPPRRAIADPPSTSSPTSFLRPGMSFTGHQSFERRRPSRSHPQPSSTHSYRLPSLSSAATSSHPARISSLDPYATLYNPASSSRGLLDYGVTPAPPPGFPSLPRSTSNGAPWSTHLARLDEPLVRDLAAPLQHLGAPTSASALNMAAAAAGSSELPRAIARPAASGSALLQRARELARARAERETMEIRATMDRLEGIPMGREERQREVERARRRVTGEGARESEGESEWRGDYAAGVERALDRMRERELDKEAEKREGEQWGVKVIIHTYSPSTPSNCITGLMHAVGVPSSPSSSSHTILEDSSAPKVKDITTFFTGSLISFSPSASTSDSNSGEPLLPTFPSSTTRSSTSLKAKQSSLEAEYWTKLGPFRARRTTREELKARAGDEMWLQEISKGWVLMRWKERDFVNVAPNECTLTIAGHYLIALNRATGAIEGLYCDPSTPPHQSLKLRPEVNSLGGAAAEGGYQLGDFGVL